ncbi:hypothetical protein MMC08_003814 [Hypocenomyce scalaris]|nr:hypothetical protein [Hypocenomyce scalaris]
MNGAIAFLMAQVYDPKPHPTNPNHIDPQLVLSGPIHLGVRISKRGVKASLQNRGTVPLLPLISDGTLNPDSKYINTWTSLKIVTRPISPGPLEIDNTVDTNGQDKDKATVTPKQPILTNVVKVDEHKDPNAKFAATLSTPLDAQPHVATDPTEIDHDINATCKGLLSTEGEWIDVTVENMQDE